MLEKPLMIFIVGTTAVGKTKLSIELCKAIGGQIINCDSKQLYKYANIMTAKATQQQMLGVPHHMLDILDLHQNCYNRNKYFTEAIKCVNDIKARGKVPVVVGGTNYYLETLLYDINIKAEDGGDQVKQQSQQVKQNNKKVEETDKQVEGDRITKQQIAMMSRQQKYGYLKKIDSVMGQKLHPNDETRITRFLQRYSETGIPPSSTYKPYEHKLRFDGSVLFWIRNSDKTELHDLMRNRIGKMVDEAGLLEIISIFKYADMRGLAEQLNAGSLQSIGYKEFKEVYDQIKQILSDNKFNSEVRSYDQIQKYVQANIKQIRQKIDKIQVNSVHSHKKNNKVTLLQKCIEVLTQNTIEYSKRQVTWIKNRIFACENNRSNFFVLEIGNKNNMKRNLMERFEQNVKSRALGILNQIETKGMGSVREDIKQFTLNKHESITEWKKYKCQDCGIEVNGSHEWNQHLNSRKHKKLLANKGKKMFFKDKNKVEAAESDKEQDKNSINDDSQVQEQNLLESSKPRKRNLAKQEKQSKQK